MQYPRIYVKAVTHKRIKKLAAKKKITMQELGDKIAVAGLKALSL